MSLHTAAEQRSTHALVQSHFPWVIVDGRVALLIASIRKGKLSSSAVCGRKKTVETSVITKRRYGFISIEILGIK